MYDYKSKIWKLTVGLFDNWLEIFSIKKSDAVMVLSKNYIRKQFKLGEMIKIYLNYGVVGILILLNLQVKSQLTDINLI